MKGFSSFSAEMFFFVDFLREGLIANHSGTWKRGREGIQTNPLLSPSQHQPYFSFGRKTHLSFHNVGTRRGKLFFFFFWLLPPLSVSTSSFPFPFPPFPQEKNIPPSLLLLPPPPPPHSQDKKEELDNWRIAKKIFFYFITKARFYFLGCEKYYDSKMCQNSP